MRSNSTLALLLVFVVLAGLGVGAFVLFLSGTGPAGLRSNESASASRARPSEGAGPVATAERDAQPTKETKPMAVAGGAAAVSAGGAASEPGAREKAASEAPPKGFAKGVVLDFDGSPAAGVKIYILAKKGFSMAPPDGETNAKGEFLVELNVKKKRTMRIRASRKGRLPAFAEEVVFRPDQTADVGALQFEPCGSLEVSVLDPGDRPIPHAQVWLELPKKNENAGEDGLGNAKDPGQVLEKMGELFRGRQATDEDGVARFAALPTGKFVLRAEPPSVTDFSGGLERSARGGARINFRAGDERRENERPAPLQEADPKEIQIAAGAVERAEFRLRGLATLTGRATVHGKPLAQDWLGLQARETSGSVLGRLAFSVRTKTDADGRFAFPPIPPGGYVVKQGDPGKPVRVGAMADPDEGFAAAMEMAGAMFSSGDGKNRDLGRIVEVREGPNVADFDFGGAVVEVFAQDADTGAPIVQATVRLFDHAPPKAEAAEANAKKKRSGAIDSFRERILGSSEGARPVRLRGRTDARGRLEFSEVEGGTYRVIGRAEGRPPSAPVDVPLVEGQYERIVVRIPAGNAIAGTVNDRRGNAVPSATVTALVDRELEPAYPDEFFSMLGPQGPSTGVDAKGNFLLKGLDRGPQVLVALANDYAPAVVKAAAPSEGAQFFLEKPGKVRVLVRRGGAPVQGVTVTLDTEAEDAPLPPAIWNQFQMMMASWPARFANTNEDGVATLERVPPGEWTIQARDFTSLSGEAGAGARAELEEAVKDLAEPGTPGGAASADDRKARVDRLRERVDQLAKPKGTRVVVVPESEATARIDLDR